MATVSEIADYLSGVRERYRTEGPDRNAMYTEMADYVRRGNLDPSMVAQAASQITGGEYTPSQVRQILAQYPAGRYAGAASGAGLNPSLQTMQRGADQALRSIGDTQAQVSGLFQQGIGRLQPYMNTGTSANQLQAALSGALGPQAQQEAYSGFTASPGQQWLVEQGERALTRNAAALGGLGGGNVRRELVQFGQGAAAQDFNNAFQRLGQVGDRGFAASTQAAGFAPQEAAIQSNLGQFAANVPLQTSGQQAQMQFQTGRDLSQNIGQTSSALASLIQQQGAGQADIMGNASQTFANLYQQAAQGDAAAREQLGSMLASLGMQGAGQFAGTPTTPMTSTNYLGQVGQLAGGVAGMLSGYGQPGTEQSSSGTVFNPATAFNPNYQLPAFNPQSGSQFLRGF